jgi:hypothetical protein
MSSAFVTCPAARLRNSSPALASSASRRWLQGGFVRIDGDQLGERRGHIAVVPLNQHQHILGTRVFRSQPPDIDCFSLAERGDDLGSDASRREGKLDFVLQVVIPAESLFFGSIGVHDGFVVDAFFANAILARLGQEKLDLSICQGVRVSVLAQDTFNAVAELVQLLLQDFVLGMVGFSGDRTHQFIQIIQGEVKDGAPPR